MAKFPDYNLYRNIVISHSIILSTFQAENVHVMLTYMSIAGDLSHALSYGHDNTWNNLW